MKSAELGLNIEDLHSGIIEKITVYGFRTKYGSTTIVKIGEETYDDIPKYFYAKDLVYHLSGVFVVKPISKNCEMFHAEYTYK